MIRSVTKSFNCSHASLSIGKWNKILTFRCVYSVFCIYKSKSTLSFVIYIYIYANENLFLKLIRSLLSFGGCAVVININ